MFLKKYWNKILTVKCPFGYHLRSDRRPSSNSKRLLYSTLLCLVLLFVLKPHSLADKRPSTGSDQRLAFHSKWREWKKKKKILNYPHLHLPNHHNSFTQNIVIYFYIISFFIIISSKVILLYRIQTKTLLLNLFLKYSNQI